MMMNAQFHKKEKLKVKIFIQLFFLIFINNFFASDIQILVEDQNWKIDIVDEEGNPFRISNIIIENGNEISFAQISERFDHDKALHDNGYHLNYQLKRNFSNNPELFNKFSRYQLNKITKSDAQYIELVIDENPTIATNPVKFYKQLKASCIIQ